MLDFFFVNFQREKSPNFRCLYFSYNGREWVKIFKQHRKKYQQQGQITRGVVFTLNAHSYQWFTFTVRSSCFYWSCLVDTEMRAIFNWTQPTTATATQYVMSISRAGLSPLILLLNSVVHSFRFVIKSKIEMCRFFFYSHSLRLLTMTQAQKKTKVTTSKKKTRKTLKTLSLREKNLTNRKTNPLFSSSRELFQWIFAEFALFFSLFSRLSVTGWPFFSVFTRQNRSHAKRQVSEQDFSQHTTQNRKLTRLFCLSLGWKNQVDVGFSFFPFDRYVCVFVVCSMAMALLFTSVVTYTYLYTEMHVCMCVQCVVAQVVCL